MPTCSNPVPDSYLNPDLQTPEAMIQADAIVERIVTQSCELIAQGVAPSYVVLGSRELRLLGLHTVCVPMHAGDGAYSWYDDDEEVYSPLEEAWEIDIAGIPLSVLPVLNQPAIILVQGEEIVGEWTGPIVPKQLFAQTVGRA